MLTTTNDGMAKVVSSWNMPELYSLQVNFPRDDEMAIVKRLLVSFGKSLRSLGFVFGTTRSVDMPWILHSCPHLRMLTFDEMAIFPEGANSFGHERLEHVGIFGYDLIVFKVDRQPQLRYRAPPANSEALRNIQWLSKQNFPSLSTIRVINDKLLERYSDFGGRAAVLDAQSPGFLDLERRCVAEGIRFEDCTGNLFGTRMPKTSSAEICAFPLAL